MKRDADLRGEETLNEMSFEWRSSLVFRHMCAQGRRRWKVLWEVRGCHTGDAIGSRVVDHI